MAAIALIDPIADRRYFMAATVRYYGNMVQELSSAEDFLNRYWGTWWDVLIIHDSGRIDWAKELRRVRSDPHLANLRCIVIAYSEEEAAVKAAGCIFAEYNAIHRTLPEALEKARMPIEREQESLPEPEQVLEPEPLPEAA